VKKIRTRLFLLEEIGRLKKKKGEDTFLIKGREDLPLSKEKKRLKKEKRKRRILYPNT